MSTRLSLEDLPPRYRAQAEAQIARCTRAKCTPAQQTLADAAKSAGKIGRTFESRGEYEYYISVVVPGIESGRIIKATPHVAFPLLTLTSLITTPSKIDALYLLVFLFSVSESL